MLPFRDAVGNRAIGVQEGEDGGSIIGKTAPPSRHFSTTASNVRYGDGRPRTRGSMALTGTIDAPNAEEALALSRTASGDSCATAPGSAPPLLE